MKRIFVAAVLIAVVLVAFGLFLFSGALPGIHEEPEQITIGIVPVAASALVYIAEDQELFTANGLNATLKDYPTGTATMDALLAHETDLAWAAEFPLVRRAFDREDISVIAVVDRFQEQRLFVRKDRGIAGPADLPGKKIGIPTNTIAEFYLGRFLDLHGVTLQEVTIVDVGAPMAGEILAGGGVDAVVTWEPYTSRIGERMGDAVIAFPLQNNQPGYGTIVGRNEWIESHHDTVVRFLKALAEAEDYAVRNPEQAQEIVRNRLAYDKDFSAIIWSENQVSLTLDQSLITAMEDEARWMIANNLTDATEVPDFRKYVYPEGLKAVKPGSVNVFS
jgi:NitT/TauT family transport system substrate-binding protein